MKKAIRIILPILAIFSVPVVSLAHEAYVLDSNFFWKELARPASYDSLGSLFDHHNLSLALYITAAVALLYLLNFLFRLSKTGKRFDRNLEKLAPIGPIVVRISIAIAFFYSALSMSFLGPELSLSVMPWAHLLRILLFVASGMIAVGFLTELAALVTLIIFCIGFFVFGGYLATYLNYFGEIIVLLIFGMREWSFDRLLFGPRKRFKNWYKYETTVVRIFYGAALLYAAINVKFLHPALTFDVINHWNLTQFHWLFPSDPLLVALGAGLAEAVIGILIIIGFEMRMTVLISLFYITLSLLFFRELVWPHLLLYGISINLLVQPEVFTLDHFFSSKGPKFWQRPMLPHRKG